MNKERLEAVILGYAAAKVKIPESVREEVKEVLSLKVEDIINPPEMLELQAEIKKFDQEYSELCALNSEFAANIETNIKGQRKECEDLKKQKSSIVARIAEIYGAGKDASAIYPQLAKVDYELGQINSFLTEIEKQKEYPNSEEVVKKAQVVFDAGIEFIKKFVKYRDVYKKKRKEQLITIKILIDVTMSELFSTELNSCLRCDKVDKLYGQTQPERALESNLEALKKEARDKIEELIKQ